MIYERLEGWVDRILLVAAILSLVVGAALAIAGNQQAADLLWAVITAAVGIRLVVSITVDLVHRQAGVDIIAVLAVIGALLFGEYLAGAVIALMLTTGTALEAYAEGRAGRELSALLARAPRVAHRYEDGTLVTRAVDELSAGDLLLVKPGEVVPVDGLVVGDPATLDEAALTGESRLVMREDGDQVSSGVVNAGSPFDLHATATAETSTYAGIVRLVKQAQDEKSPSVRLADRYAALFVPLTLAVAALAWIVSGDPVRALSVLVVATPCPLLLAVPIAIVAGISRAARRGIIVKGGGALETLARSKVLLFDKTGTLTAGRPHLAEVEAGEELDGDEVLRLAASLDQVSPHVLAAAIVHAARERKLPLAFPEQGGVARPGLAARPRRRDRARGARAQAPARLP
jgi:cation transport ATPase